DDARALLLVNPCADAVPFALPVGLWYPALDSSQADGCPLDPSPLDAARGSRRTAPALSVQALVGRHLAGGLAGDPAFVVTDRSASRDTSVRIAASAALEPSSSKP